MVSGLVIAFCLSAGPARAEERPWPGGGESERVDITQSDMGNNMSGAVWNPERHKLWLASNSGIVWRMSCGSGLDPLDPASWSVDTSGGDRAKWSIGGDTEAITLADWDEDVIFVGVERSNGNHRLIREYDVSGTLGTATLTNAWDLLEMQIGADNYGLEALSFVTDAWLAYCLFVDQNGNPYPQSAYGTGGLFFAGLQDNAHIYVFDLDRRPGSPQGAYTFVGEYDTGQTEIAGLEFDRSTGVLYAWHNYDWRTSDPDDRLQALSLDPEGTGPVKTLQPIRTWLGPRVANNEGIALVSIREGNAFNERIFFLATDGAGISNSVGIYPRFPFWHTQLWTAVGGFTVNRY